MCSHVYGAYVERVSSPTTDELRKSNGHVLGNWIDCEAF
jgi:hypothetical protein